MRLQLNSKRTLQWWTKMKNNLFPIAPSGIKYVSISGVVFVLFFLFDFDILAFLSFLITLALAFTFRNPEREVAVFEKGSVVSPVDGIVTSIENLKDEDFAYKVEVDSSCLDVGVLRSPMDAKVSSLQFFHGARISEDTALHKVLNENASLVFENSDANSIKIQHRLKQSFAPLSIDAMEAQELRQGTRYGMQVNGTTTLYFPQNFRLNVNVGSPLEASQTLLGYFS